MNVLSRDLRNGCPLHPDVTGYTYEGELALGPQDQVLARRKNPAWQKQVLGYLTSGNAVLLARRRGTGLDRASMQTIRRWPVLARVDGYTLFARGPSQPARPNAPKRSGAAAASRNGRAPTSRETE